MKSDGTVTDTYGHRKYSQEALLNRLLTLLTKPGVTISQDRIACSINSWKAVNVSPSESPCLKTKFNESASYNLSKPLLQGRDYIVLYCKMLPGVHIHSLTIMSQRWCFFSSPYAQNTFDQI